MSSSPDMAERHGRMLAELSELGLALARDLQGRALAAEAPEEGARLASAFHRVARGVRQSIALEARLARDAERAAREARDDAEGQRSAAVARRRNKVRKTVARMIWMETGSHRQAELSAADLDDRLEAESLDDGFLDEPEAAQIARFCRLFGVMTPEQMQAEMAELDAELAAAPPEWFEADEMPPDPEAAAPDAPPPDAPPDGDNFRSLRTGTDPPYVP